MSEITNTFPVETMMERYCFYRQKYVMGTKDRIVHVPYRYTSRQVWEHMNGNISLCVFAGPHMTKFLTFDIDLKDECVVKGVVSTLFDLGIPEDRIYVSDSGGKGYHVDIFFTDGVYNWKARELYGLVIFMGQFDPRKVEYRPTPKQAIKLPLGIHQGTHRRCWFVDLRSMKPIKNYDYIEMTQTVDTEVLDEVLKKGNALRFEMLLADVTNERVVKKRPVVSDIKIDAPGTRQKRTLEYALLMYRNGADEADIVAGLERWMSEQDPTMYKDPPAEVERNIRNIARWVANHGERGDVPRKQDSKAPATRARIYESDMMRILEAPTKSARMLAFLITANCDMYGMSAMGTKRLCEELGVKSNKSIVTAADAIVGMGMFDKKAGGYKNIGNKLQAVTNKYTFPADYHRSGRSVEVGVADVREAYAKAALGLCDRSELKIRLTATEYKEIMAYDKDQSAAS